MCAYPYVLILVLRATPPKRQKPTDRRVSACGGGLHIAYCNRRSPPDRHNPPCQRACHHVPPHSHSFRFDGHRRVEGSAMTPSFQFFLAQSQLPDNGWMRARPLVGGCLPVHGATNTTRLINWASEKDGVLLA